MSNDRLPACRACGYAANPIAASHCKFCHSPLTAKNTSQRRSPTFPWAVVPLIGLLFGTAILFWFWRNNTPSPITTSKPSSNVSTVAATQSQAARTNPAGGLQTYNSLSEVQNVPKGIFNYASAIPFAPLHSPEITNAIAQAQPKFRLRYTEPPLGRYPSAGISITMLLNGDVSFAQSSRPLKDEEYIRAKQRGVTLQQVPIALDGIAFFVHPKLPIRQLSLDQLQKILTGKITNWRQLGGPNLPVVPFIFDPKLASSTLRLLLESPENQKFGRNAQVVRDHTTSIRKVASTPGGLSYGTAAIVMRQHSVRAISLAKPYSKRYVKPFDRGKINAEAFVDGTYPLTRRLFVVVRRDGTFDEQAGIAYANLMLSQEGQRLVEQAGFVPIRN